MIARGIIQTSVSEWAALGDPCHLCREDIYSTVEKGSLVIKTDSLELIQLHWSGSIVLKENNASWRFSLQLYQLNTELAR